MFTDSILNLPLGCLTLLNEGINLRSCRVITDQTKLNQTSQRRIVRVGRWVSYIVTAARERSPVAKSRNLAGATAQ